MSKTVAKFLERVAHGITAPMKPYRRTITRALLCERMTQTVDVTCNGVSLRFQSATARGLHDILSMGRGEPETVRWIDNIPPGTLWDIGANIGVYSLYAAARGHRVIAFEPSAASFACLCRNIEINGFADRIAAYCIALSDKTGIETLWMANTNAGHSMHSIRDRLGRPFGQPVPAFSGRDAQKILGVPAPEYLKIDVDGVEPAILGGILPLAKVRSIVIEAETDERARELAAIIEPAGLCLNTKLSEGHARNLVFDRDAARLTARG